MAASEQGNISIGDIGNVSSQFAVGQAINQQMSNVQSQVSLPDPKDVDIATELNRLREILAALETDDRGKISNALNDAEEELKKPKPDKDEVGGALDRALNYAKKAQGFVEVIEKLKKPVTNTAAWLGENWYKLLAVIPLV